MASSLSSSSLLQASGRSGSVLLLLLLLLLTVAQFAPVVAAHEDVDNKYCNTDNTYCFNWTITSENITIQIEAQTKGWVGFGLSPSSGMSGADVYMSSVIDGVPTVRDRHVPEGTHSPATDAQQDAEDISGAILENGGSMVTSGPVTYIKFSRKIDTGDNDDEVISSDNNGVIWSYRVTDANIDCEHDYHAPSAVQINFHTSTVHVGLDSKILAHGSLMFLAWPVMSATGVFAAAGLKSWKWWFFLHAGMQSMAVFLCFVSFCVIVSEVGNGFHGFHQVLGLLIFITSLIQPVFGCLTNRRFKKNPNDTSRNIFPTETHHWIGRVLVPLAACNIFFGLSLAGASTTVFVLYSLWFIILVAVFVVVILRHYGILLKKPAESKAEASS